jgi:TetR/AcrR family transcriptional repressor of nem operon
MGPCAASGTTGGVMGARTDTRARIVDIAERHMMQVGYAGFSFHDIASELGVKPPAVHWHFRTKPDLALAVIEAYGTKFDGWAASVEGLTPAARVDAYLDVGRHVVATGRACALGMLAAQFHTVPAEVGAAALAVQRRILHFYATNLDAGRLDGAVAFEGDAGDKAVEVGCAVVGAQQLARALGPAAYDRVAAQIRRDLRPKVTR